jgi:hypothetical protein
MVIGSTVRPDERLLLSGDEAGTAPEDRKFRTDVQGLRAIAVMLVGVISRARPRLGRRLRGRRRLLCDLGVRDHRRRAPRAYVDRIHITVGAFQLGVTRVEFEITGGGQTSAVIGPAASAHGFWGLYWHTTDVPNGIHVVRSIAYDEAGDHSIGPGITVRVAN